MKRDILILINDLYKKEYAHYCVSHPRVVNPEFSADHWARRELLRLSALISEECLECAKEYIKSLDA